MKKRIAIWTHGGIGSGLASQGQPVIMRLVQWLSTKYDVDVYSVRPPNKEFVPSGYSIFSTPHSARSSFRNWLYLIGVFLKINKEKKYDGLYAFWGYPAGIVAFFLGRWIRRVVVVHLQGGDSVGISDPPYGVFRHPLRAALCRYVYNRCSRLVALTEFQKARLIERKIKRPIDVIPYGVDNNIFSFRAKSFAEKTYHFLHVGNLTPVKGQDMLLKTFSEIAGKVDAVLTIVGPDYDNKFLINLANSLGLDNKVKFIGHQLHHDLPFFYHQAHVLIHTSLFEGQGVVFSEAASCGTLLAGTNVGMLADMGDHCAIRTDYGKHEHLAQQILERLRSPEEMRKQIHAAKVWAHERDEQFTFRSIKKVVDEILFNH